MNLIVDYLTCLWEYAKEEITREIGAVADLSRHRGSIPGCANITDEL